MQKYFIPIKSRMQQNVLKVLKVKVIVSQKTSSPEQIFETFNI